MRFVVAMFLAALAVVACSAQTSKTGSGLTGGSTGSSPSVPPVQSPASPDAGTDTGTPDGGGFTPPDTTDAGTDVPPANEDPTLARTTYQAPPQNLTTRSVSSSNTGGSPSATAYAYSVFPAYGTWSPIQTVPYPIIDLAPSNSLGSGTFTDTNGVSRLGYRFTISPGASPDWGGAPRVEFDSASGPVQNPSDGMPSNNGWASGVVTDGMEMWITWSMYLDSSFSLNQQWATLFQLHPGNTNYDLGSSKNGWPNPGWPTLNVNDDAIAFGLGPDAISPGQVWSGHVSDLRGKWTDLAIHAKFSTGADGLMEFYVNGAKVGSKSGANMVYATTGGTPPWFYLKQGYYRAADTGTTDTVYQTPMLVSVNQN